MSIYWENVPIVDSPVSNEVAKEIYDKQGSEGYLWLREANNEVHYEKYNIIEHLANGQQAYAFNLLPPDNPDMINRFNCMLIYDIDYSPYISERSGKKIEYWQTISIRYEFKKIYRPKGYPANYLRNMAYFSNMGIMIPYGYELSISSTKALWEQDKKAWWRRVKVLYEGVDPFTQWIMNYGLPWLSIFTPQNIMLLVTGGAEIFVFPNMGFRETLNDKLIFANWDMVKKILRLYGV